MMAIWLAEMRLSHTGEYQAIKLQNFVPFPGYKRSSKSMEIDS